MLDEPGSLRKSQDSNKQNKKYKQINNNWHHRYSKKSWRILWTVICQQTGKPRRNG